MSADGDEARFSLEGNRLSVSGELRPAHERRYSEGLLELLKTDEEEMALDLTGLHHMSAACVKSTCRLALPANQRERSVVVLASPVVGPVLCATGLDKLTEVRVAPG